MRIARADGIGLPTSRHHGGAAGERQAPAADRQQRVAGRVEAIPPARPVEQRRTEACEQEGPRRGWVLRAAAWIDGEAGQPRESTPAQVAEGDPAPLLVD